MTSSTPASSFLRTFALALAVPLLALAACHCGLEALSRWAEARPGYYLWRDDDYLHLLDRAKFSRSGQRRLLILGASEAGEGLVDEVLARRLAGVSVDHLAFDGALCRDVVLQLEYLEKAYGSGAVPERIVVGISPRFIANITMANQRRRFSDAVNLYSPDSADSADGFSLVEKDPFHAAWSWFKFRVHQTERYRSAVRAALSPSNSMAAGLAKAKTRSRVRTSERQLRNVLTLTEHWRAAHAWRASDHREAVGNEIAALVEFARRNHAHLYFVNMPEWRVNKELFAPGVYEDYLQTMETLRGGFPLLDLGDLLSDGEFIDSVHPTAKGAVRVSAATADFILQSDRTVQAGNTP